MREKSCVSIFRRQLAQRRMLQGRAAAVFYSWRTKFLRMVAEERLVGSIAEEQEQMLSVAAVESLSGRGCDTTHRGAPQHSIPCDEFHNMQAAISAV